MALIGQSAGGREDFNDTDHAKEEEHHPDDLVAFEDIAYFLVHNESLSMVYEGIKDFLPVP
jgi:hypothetical protein